LRHKPVSPNRDCKDDDTRAARAATSARLAGSQTKMQASPAGTADEEATKRLEQREEEPRAPPVMKSFVMKTLGFLTVSDVFVLYVLFATWSLRCSASFSLRGWLFGSLLWGWPLNFVTRHFAQRASFRWAYSLEVLLFFLGFVWLCIGTLWISDAQGDCASHVPGLFWTVFVLTMFVWSVLTTMTSCLIIATVLSILVPKAAPE